MKMDKKEAQFQEKFKKFPSSFNLEIKNLVDIKEVSKKKLEENIVSDEYETNTERIRIFDLLSFLAWSENDKKAAYSYNKKALELDKENIVSQFNKLWMRREDGYLTEANEEFKYVVKLAESKNSLLLIGKAEMACSYSVFGPSYLLKSKDMLEEVICDKSVKDIDFVTLTSWKLELGIVYRMLCNSGSSPKQGWGWNDEEKFIKRGTELLYEVACSDTPARWRGRCWVSLAELVHITSIGDGLKNCQKKLFPKEIKETNIECLLDLAIKTCVDDYYVQKTCGKLYKYLKKLDKAEDLLRKSLERKDTSYAHHHLALVLKMKLRDRLFKNKKKRHYNGNCNGHEAVNDLSIKAKGNAATQSPTRECNVYSQNVSTTNIIRNDSTSVESILANLEIDENDKSSTREPGSNLQNTSTRQITRAVAKGFKFVFSIPDNETKAVQEILSHLEKAIELGNSWASLDKGIILRQIKQNKEAFDVFLTMLKTDCSISAILEISCYENLGACCRDIAEQETDLEEKRKREIDAVIYWRKALEKIASKKDKTLYFPKEEWMSYPILKDMFQHRKFDIGMLKELAELGEVLQRPAETRYLYQELSKLDEEVATDPEIICGVIKSYLKEKRYEEASQMLKERQNEGIEFDKKFSKLVYLECAFYCASIGKTETAGERCRQAFETDKSFDIDVDKTTVKSNFDIFILYDEDREINNSTSVFSEKVEEVLSANFGLKITSNSKYVDPGKQRWAVQTQQMESSEHIVLLLDTNEEPRGDLEYFISVAQGISKRNKLILNIILFDECTCPLQLTCYPTMRFRSELLQSKDDFFKWIRDFVFHLLRIDDYEE